MADRFYSVVKGEQMTNLVTEGSSTSSEAIELRINDSVSSRKMEVLIGLEAIKHYLMTVETNPIA